MLLLYSFSRPLWAPFAWDLVSPRGRGLGRVDEKRRTVPTLFENGRHSQGMYELQVWFVNFRFSPAGPSKGGVDAPFRSVGRGMRAPRSGGNRPS